MSTPQKLSIAFAQEDSFSAAVTVVRALSEGSLKRDPAATVQHAEPKPTNIRPYPARQIVNPRVRSFRPMTEWQVRELSFVARTGKTAAEFRAARAAREKARWLKAKAKQ